MTMMGTQTGLHSNPGLTLMSLSNYKTSLCYLFHSGYARLLLAYRIRQILPENYSCDRSVDELLASPQIYIASITPAPAFQNEDKNPSCSVGYKRTVHIIIKLIVYGSFLHRSFFHTHFSTILTILCEIKKIHLRGK